jgi:hypothetical protein
MLAMPDEPWLTKKELAEVLKVSARTIRPQLPPKLDAEASRYVIGDQAREGVAIPGFRIFAARSGRDPDAGEQQTATSPSFPP